MITGTMLSSNNGWIRCYSSRLSTVKPSIGPWGHHRLTSISQEKPGSTEFRVTVSAAVLRSERRVRAISHDWHLLRIIYTGYRRSAACIRSFTTSQRMFVLYNGVYRMLFFLFQRALIHSVSTRLSAASTPILTWSEMLETFWRAFWAFLRPAEVIVSVLSEFLTLHSVGYFFRSSSQQFREAAYDIHWKHGQ